LRIVCFICVSVIFVSFLNSVSLYTHFESHGRKAVAVSNQQWFWHAIRYNCIRSAPSVSPYSCQIWCDYHFDNDWLALWLLPLTPKPKTCRQTLRNRPQKRFT
jgi:hypothetical protein